MSEARPIAAVFDCNVYFQPMLASNGAAHAYWQKVLSGHVRLSITSYILSEIRGLPEHRKLRKYQRLTPELIE